MENSSNFIKADLHNHFETPSTFKYDFNFYIDIASSRLGKKGILGFVNFEDNRFEEFSELKGYERYFLNPEKSIMHIPEKDLFIVRGEEVPTHDGHLLVLATPFNSKIPPGNLLEKTIENARKYNGIIIASHPFYYAGIGRFLEKNSELLPFFDAIEVYNGESVFGFPFLFPFDANRKAQSFYNLVSRYANNLGAISVSDSHSPAEICTSYTLLKDESRTKLCNITLRKMIRNAGKNGDKRTNSYFGTLKHLANLLAINLGLR